VRAQRSKYLSIDIERGKAMKVMDLTRLDIPDNTFDVVVCCHVLEHIRKDLLAISEIYRVLRNNGVAVFQVPLYGEVTEKVKNPTRGDHYHIWHPGLDYPKRYEKIGFKVSSIGIKEINSVIVDRLSLNDADSVDLCVKTSQ
jgi:SAM-dependent methyltransferase